MTAHERMEELLELFRSKLPEADFTAAYGKRSGSRRPGRVAVTAEVDGETVKPGAGELRFRFRIFLPEDAEPDRAESLFAAMCSLAGENCPGFSAISRGAAERDKATGLLCVGCTLSLLDREGGAGALGKKAVLGGREYRVAGTKTTVNHHAEAFVAIGETEPFAQTGRTEYTVELEGIDVSGLERLAWFTAELGEGPDAVYQNCRWKSLSDTLRKAVFVSTGELAAGL